MAAPAASAIAPLPRVAWWSRWGSAATPSPGASAQARRNKRDLRVREGMFGQLPLGKSGTSKRHQAAICVWNLASHARRMTSRE